MKFVALGATDRTGNWGTLLIHLIARINLHSGPPRLIARQSNLVAGTSEIGALSQMTPARLPRFPQTWLPPR